MKKEGYIDALDLAKYISKKYKDKFNTDISSIKLQKSLYFLFAYWGGFVRNLNRSKGEGGIETENVIYKEKLFDNRIEAWIYGPVVTDVYHNFNSKIPYDSGTEAKFNALPMEVKSFINDLLEDLFSTSDFKLVDISHNDKCWRNHFDEKANRHNEEIPKDEIIDEYSRK